MYLEILPIAMIFILTKKNHKILSHIASINPLFTNFTIEKQSATTIFNITEHWHRWPHCKERDPHVNKKFNGDNDEWNSYYKISTNPECEGICDQSAANGMNQFTDPSNVVA